MKLIADAILFVQNRKRKECEETEMDELWNPKLPDSFDR